MGPDELRARAMKLEADADQRGAAELLAAPADWDPAVLRRAMLGVSGSGTAGRRLLAEAVKVAEYESGA